MCIMHTGIDNRDVMSKYDACYRFIHIILHMLGDRICMMVLSQTMASNFTKAMCVQSENMFVLACQVNRS